MKRIGVTGSLGSGKSSVAQWIAKRGGYPLFDADAAVHALYRPGGAAVAAVLARFPGVEDGEGGVSRERLRGRLDAQGFADLEGIIHPLVGAEQEAFMVSAGDARAVVLDIPLLLEGSASGKGGADVLVVVDAPEEVRRRRFRERTGADAAAFSMLDGRQMPIAEKRARADFVLENGGAWEASVRQLEAWHGVWEGAGR